MDAPKFKPGDAVLRPADVFDASSRMMTGIVLRRYSKHSRLCGYYPELYDVRWDDGTESGGYLPHGLRSAT